LAYSLKEQTVSLLPLFDTLEHNENYRPFLINAVIHM
jgi:hypothetical protein